MSADEFDRLIENKASQASYEYDANDWNDFSDQLAAARKKKRVVLFAYTASGIAASVAIFIIAIAPMLSKKGVTTAQYASKPQIHSVPLPPPTSNDITNNSINIQSSGKQTAVAYHASPVKKQAHQVMDTAIHNTSDIAYNNSITNAPIQPVEKKTDTPAPEQRKKQNDYGTLMPLAYYEKEKRPDSKGVNISVAGGVNYGTINTGYALGAAAEKKINNKLGIEVTVAYVGNNASAPGQAGLGVFTPGGSMNGVPPPKAATVVDLPLNYLQCAPMADYKLSNKFTLAAGADLQRLLQDHSVTVLYNDDIKTAPLIDVGILLRTEYKISNHLKAGLSYRVGANNVFSSGNDYLDRNYMQVQLKYKLH